MSAIQKLKIHPINMVIFGPPGVGKGSYCSLFAKDLGLQKFVVGDYFRSVLSSNNNSNTKDPALKEIEKNLQSGGLISDDIVNKVVQQKLVEAKENGIILDGYPRTIKQAKFLKENLNIHALFNLTLRQDVLVRKLLGRRICPCCNYAYNVVGIMENDYQMPAILPKNDHSKCDKCNVELISRDDDTKEVIENRLKLYNQEVKDILEFFRQEKLICDFEPKRGYDDYPKMLETVISFVNSKFN